MSQTKTANDIAALFFNPASPSTEMDHTYLPSGSKYRVWHRFITAKQKAWLFGQWERDHGHRIHQGRGHDFCQGGEFVMGGNTYYWDANEIKGGAARLTVKLKIAG